MPDTLPLFRDDPYRRGCEATVLAVNERGGIVLDQTVFYATSGGQPGDTGMLVLGGVSLTIGATVPGESKAEIVHVPAEPASLASAGMPVRAEINWDRRHRHMRMHTALHLLCVLVKGDVTGGQIGEAKSRLDFNLPEGAPDRERLEDELNRLIAEGHAVSARWITDAELAARPALVRTMSVKPPMGTGRVRLIEIECFDLQPCGGTHVRSTREIGFVRVTQIEKKGKLNRRVRLALV